jgi:hypothetical protein
MITGSSVNVGAKMERDSSSRSLVMQQNFYEVPQLEINSRSPRISRIVFQIRKLESLL